MASGATIDVLYFGRIAELAGTRQEQLPWPLTQDGTHLLEYLRARHPALAQAMRLRLAINQAHARPDAAIAAGDEVAVFEPVTGG